ncbi:hypothetical protein [uncultured Paludibaculum sp.]|uniref:hypothetical protein n=1 Tax=uncultured Paludibaculum sp. TaxID=1765020 RepID=UPI002AAAED89|nr:hypothetical protein [uncultured Paludibaculum sp.]
MEDTNTEADVDAWGPSRPIEVELLKDDLSVYRQLENWGATLFLGGIALLGKQFVEWGQTGEETRRIVFRGPEFLLPAIVGIVAFVYLRIVNARSHRAVTTLFELAKCARTRRFGALGWLIALMPLTFGSTISFYLVSSGGRTLGPLWLVVGAACVGVAIAALYDYRLRHQRGSDAA